MSWRKAKKTVPYKHIHEQPRKKEVDLSDKHCNEFLRDRVISWSHQLRSAKCSCLDLAGAYDHQVQPRFRPTSGGAFRERRVLILPDKLGARSRYSSSILSSKAN